MRVGQQSTADQTLDCLVQLQRWLAPTATAELLVLIDGHSGDHITVVAD
jgi:hypothetical protein